MCKPGFINRGFSVVHKVKKKESYDFREYRTCPFCLNQCIETSQGKIRCPVCSASFEIDDRIEYIFADTNNIRLPTNGIVCGS